MNAGARACALLAVWLLGACTSTAEVGADCEGSGCSPQKPDSGMLPAINLPAPRAPSGDVDKLDLLFVVDTSRSTMVAQQAALAAVLPRFLQKLVTGEGDGSGAPEFHPARDLHVGVVSSSVAVDAADPLPDCALPGFDGVLQTGEQCPVTAQDIAGAAIQPFDSLEPAGDSNRQ